MESNSNTLENQIILSKLVRDKVIDNLTEKGAICKTKILSKPKYIIYLKKTLLEQSKELVKTKFREELVTVLVEIWEVFICLIKCYNISLTSIIINSKRKSTNKLTNIFLETITVNKDHAHYDNFHSIGIIKSQNDHSTTFSIRKLVFDNLIKGEDLLKTSLLSDKALCYESKRMLVDMSRMLLNNSSDAFNILGQLYCILDKIISIHKIELTHIIELAEKKQEEEGSYEKQTFLISCEAPKDNLEVENYIEKYKPKQL